MKPLKINRWRRINRGWNFDILTVLFIGLVATVFSHYILLLPQGPFFWDESLHAGYGLSIYDALHQGDWASFWEITNCLKLWPFLHSWVAGAFLTVFGPTMVNARLSSLILLVPSLVLLFQVSRIAFPGRGRAVGLIASLLFASSPLVLYMASTCMLEMLEVLLVCAFFRVYFGAINGGRKILFALAGLLLALLYMTKYNYGLLLLLAFCLDVIIQWWREREGKDRGRTQLRNAVIVVIGFAIPVGVWLASGYTTEKLNILTHYWRGAVLGGGTILELSNFNRALFYIRSLANIYTCSIWIFLIFIGGFISGFFFYSKRKIRLIHLAFLVMFIACTVVKNEQDRYLMPAFPLITIMGALFLFNLYEWFRTSSKRMIVYVLFILILIDLLVLPFYCRWVGNHTGGLLGSFRYPASPVIKYTVLMSPSLYPEILKQPYSYLNPSADYAAAKHNVQDIWNFIAETIGKKGSLGCLSVFQEFSQHLWRWYSYQTGISIFPDWDKKAEQCDYFAYIDIGPDSPYYNKEYVRNFLDRNRQWIQFLLRQEKDDSIQAVATRYYPDISVIVKIFSNNGAFTSLQ